MKNLLFINACVRGEDSRTMLVARPILKELSKIYKIEEINLTYNKFTPVGKKEYKERSNGNYDSYVIENATKLANADKILIVAPFWDMSFPSCLKVFLENVSINGITFKDTESGETKGNCKADKLLLITTRGMNIKDNSKLEQATPYLKALSWLWGIGEVITLSAYGMDLCDSVEQNNKINQTIAKGLKICEDF